MLNVKDEGQENSSWHRCLGNDDVDEKRRNKSGALFLYIFFDNDVLDRDNHRSMDANDIVCYLELKAHVITKK